VVGLAVVELDVELAVGTYLREWWGLQLLSLMWDLQLVPTLCT